MPAVQLFQRLSGKITREAPAMANRTRKASQLRRSRRRFTSLGASRTSAKRAARPRLRSRATVVSWVGSTGVEVVLITWVLGPCNVLALARGKHKSNSWRHSEDPRPTLRGKNMKANRGGSMKEDGHAKNSEDCRFRACGQRHGVRAGW